MSNKNNPLPYKLGAIAILLIAAVFTFFVFIHEQPCDIDQIYFWCHVHPFTAIDGIGAILFYGGILYNVVLWWKFYDTMDGKPFMNWLGMLAAAAGTAIMWLL